jgi:hypothetical protein
MKKSLVLIGWSLSTLLTLAVCIGTLHFLRKPQFLAYQGMGDQNSGHQPLIASKQLRQMIKGVTSDIQTADARPIIIAEFLEKNHSPLTPYPYWGEFLTKLADKYQMDFRLLPAIAMQESNLCKKIPEGTFNCLGLGIHARGTWGFPSFEANFEKAAEVLRQKYINEGLLTPDQIQDKYTPGSNGSWEFAVNHFMDKLETADF